MWLQFAFALTSFLCQRWSHLVVSALEQPRSRPGRRVPVRTARPPLTLTLEKRQLKEILNGEDPDPDKGVCLFVVKDLRSDE